MFRSVTLMSLSMLLIALTNAPPMAGAAIVLNEDFDSGGLNVPLCIINTSNPSRPAITLAGRYNWPEDPSQWAWMMFSMTGANATTPQFTVLASNIGGGVYYPASWTRYVYSYDQQNWFFFDNGSLNSGSLIYSFSNNSAFNQLTDNEWFIKFSSHIFRQSAFMKTQFRAHYNN